MSSIQILDNKVIESINHLRMGIAIFDADDVLVYCNEHFKYVYCSLEDVGEILGWTYKEILELLVGNGEFAGREAVNDPEGWIAKRMENHRQKYSAITERLAMGNWVQVKERRMFDDHVICLWTDVTEQQRYVARLEGAMECIADGFAVWDQSGQLIRFNDKFANRHGTKDHPLYEGQSRMDVMCRLSESGLLELGCSPEEWVEQMTSGFRSAEFHKDIAYADDTFFILSERRSSEGGTVSSLTDITELKHKERELIYRGHSLEHAVSELELVNDSLERQGETLVAMAEQIDANHSELEERDRKLRKIEARQRAILNTMGEALVVLDYRGNIETLNSVAESILNLDSRVAINYPLVDFIQIEVENELIGDIPAYFSALHEENNDTGAQRRELIIRRQDKSSLPVEVSIAEASEGKEKLYVITMRDISGRKESEQTLKEYQESLEQRVEERTRELSLEIELHKETEEKLVKARVEAETANWAKSEFLANMSHELRTPLNGIIGFAEMMKMETFGALGDPHYEEYSHDISASGLHLLGIINDILDVSKIELGAFELEESNVDIRDILKDCTNMIRERAAARHLNLEINIPEKMPLVYADNRRLKQVIINLITNAVKFTMPEGTITIGTIHHDNGEVEISVKDTGIGIPAEDIDNVILPFTQVANSKTRNYDGVGLGLSICNSLAIAHGGRLELSSVVGEGTEIRLILPAERTLP